MAIAAYTQHRFSSVGRTLMKGTNTFGMLASPSHLILQRSSLNVVNAICTHSMSQRSAQVTAQRLSSTYTSGPTGHESSLPRASKPLNVDGTASPPRLVSGASRHHLINVASIIHLIKRDQLIAAYRIFKELEATNLYALQNLPSDMFSELILQVMQNKSLVLRSRSIHNRYLHVVEMFDTMKKLKVKPTFYLLTSMIAVYGRLGRLEEVKAIYADIKQYGMNPMDSTVLANISTAYILCGDEAVGIEYFQRLRKVDVSIYPFRMLLRAYSKKCDEEGIVRTIEMMRMAGFQWDAQILCLVCDFYMGRKDDVTALRLIQKFQSEGGRLSMSLKHRLMRSANDSGEHRVVLKLIGEINLGKPPIRTYFLEEKLVAHAGLGDETAAWATFSEIVVDSFPDVRVCRALAKFIGPITPTGMDAIGNLRYAVRKANGSLSLALNGLLGGYASLGDAASAKQIISIIESHDRSTSLAIHVKVIYAYLETGDFDGAFSHMEELYARYMTLEIIHIYPLLVHAIKYKPEAIDSVLDYYKRALPEVVLDVEMERATRRANIGPSTLSEAQYSDHFEESTSQITQKEKKD
ncbi:hypothetical protein BASA61_001014 [Batrachochytrium salamandrivorans]|nr:hypothetical protein BASA62_009027 [Batrachochytrium salamandrivorans]KAH6564452.1 hypothetical protein BASA60_010321 [Batrachochytrium salamandrivorans]KAH6602557.1 hypothetical protein BASA61_001014 [Batrachochytrium salamandrivorans]KAH9275154.1 hypothetical protein BASA83_002378 [Batrachochytrium salamandrivorans]KAJ1345294.1 hypothetical protein BSLG_000807 [Batrachochytrium salamandrivorans]